MDSIDLTGLKLDSLDFFASSSSEESLWIKVFASILKVLVLSYAQNIGIRSAISSGNNEELDIIWQPQIKEFN